MTGPAAAAFAKVNLCLLLGGRRPDGRHELVTLFQSVTLADELRITPLAAGAADVVVCPGVAGTNLVDEALTRLRAAGWNAPPLRVEIEKRIPVAAGMGGGSADAAAILRHAPRLAAVAPAVVAAIASALGADVPGQLDPGASLGTGAGDRVEPLPDLTAHGLLVLPPRSALSTAAVYREADRLGLGRPAEELEALAAELRRAAATGAPVPERLIVNDLEAPARSLCPAIDTALALARDAGADQAMVCGSGPTVIGIYWGHDGGGERAAAAARRLAARYPGAIAADPVRRGTGASAPNQ
ncbi:MAG: 4-(cytidine 5'-diphospho)-2-C-methyl-D-erythritol kinase [Solirubrobacteraceae bacterium]|jgi:4-diphosphocytidyl-2-C-methyl-D-erythritol kinase